MVFSSVIFLFVFLPAFLSVYYLTPFRYKSLVILMASYLFYAWWRVDFLLLFVAVTLWNYFFGIAIHRASSPAKAKKYLTVGLMGNLSTLAYFKYANFGIESLNGLLVAFSGQPLPLANVILPIGISFYIFQAISYLIDVYRKDTPPTGRLVDFAAFIALFPQLIAGPVLRYKDVASQFQHREHSWALFSSGVSLFMVGFVKKVLIADSVAPLADAIFNVADPTTGEAWIGALAYSVQLYFDFSGYSDMAVGLGLMMGFRFINNFNQPYISQSITEFWRRWHISLSSWLRDYLYISLGGNRKGSLLTYRNLILTMLLGGLWHGASWTFVLWGAWHGCLLAFERLFNLAKYKGFSVWRWLLTMLFVVLGWVIFRAESLEQSGSMYLAMFGISGKTHQASSHLIGMGLELSILALALGYVVVRGFALHSGWLQQLGQEKPMRILMSSLRIPLFGLSLSSLIASSYSPFLYFQF